MKADLTKAIASELEQSITEVDVIDGKYMHIQNIDLFEDKMSLEIWFRIVGLSIDWFDYKLYDEDGNWIGKQLTKAEKDEIIAAIESYTAPIIEGESEEEDYFRKHDHF
jgi:hypothetical protein